MSQLPDLLDEPLGDASLIPTFLLCRFARRSVTVALSGADGGDEVFAGYPTYQAHASPTPTSTCQRGCAERLVRPAVERLPVSLANLSLDFRLKRFIEGMPFDAPERHAVWLGSFAPVEQRDLFTDEALAQMDAPPSYDAFREILRSRTGHLVARPHAVPGLEGLLGEGVLTKVDRASMACSLEVRVPMLDRSIVELAASFPGHLKLHGFTTKYVLKRALRGSFPERS